MPALFAPATSSYLGIQWSGKARSSYIGVELFAADNRSLSSSPVTIVYPTNPRCFLFPGQTVFVGKQGVLAYSASPAHRLQYSDGTVLAVSLDGGVSWDGSAAVVATVVAPLSNGADGDDTNEWTAQVGLALQIAAPADVTGGDAICSIIQYYTEYDLTGLL